MSEKTEGGSTVENIVIRKITADEVEDAMRLADCRFIWRWVFFPQVRSRK